VAGKYKINGKYVTKEEWDATPGIGLDGGVPMCTIAYSESKPLISDALGVMKSQVGEMREMIKRERIMGVRVLENGQLEISSRNGRREVMRALNEARGCRMVDADGGYGDG